MQLWIISASWLFLGLCKFPRIRHWGTPVQWTMTEHNYTRTELLNLKACHPSTKPLGHGVWKTLCELGLSTRGPTPCGCRGGSQKQRNIDTVVGNRPTRGWQDRTICPENVMSLPRKRHQCFSSVPLDFCLLNTHSGSNKGDEIVEFVTENDLDILALTETWLKPEHDVARGDMTPAGYTLYEEPRLREKRGAELPSFARPTSELRKLGASRPILSRA